MLTPQQARYLRLAALACLAMPAADPLRADIGGWDLLSTVTTSQPVVTPKRMVVDPAGNLYVADSTAGAIVMRDTQGKWSVVMISSDGQNATMKPYALALGGQGSLFVSEANLARASQIRMRDRQGRWSILATSGSKVGQVSSPGDLAADSSGNLLVADTGNNRVQMRTPEGAWSVLGDKDPTRGRLAKPSCLEIDGQGNLYVGASGVRKRDLAGNWTILPPDDAVYGLRETPTDIALDAEGNLYICGGFPAKVERRDPKGVWADVATVGITMGLGYVRSPSSLATDREGNLYVGDGGSDFTIQRRSPLARWEVLASPRTETGPAGHPAALAADGAGNLYVADKSASRVMMRSPDGAWSEVAGPGLGLGQVSGPHKLAADEAGNLYVADTTAFRLQRRDARGRWSLVGDTSGVIDLYTPLGALAWGPAGTLLAAQGSPARLLSRDVSGAWKVVGKGGPLNYPVTAPQWMAADANGDVYEATTDALLVHHADGSTTTVSSSSTGPAVLGMVTSLAADPAGNLLTAESGDGPLLHLRTRSGQWAALPEDPGVTGTGLSAGCLAADGQGSVYASDGSLLARYRMPAHLLAVSSQAVPPLTEAQQVTISVRVLPNSGPVTGLEMSLLESAPAGAPGISSITYSLGADAADWQLQTDIPNPRHVVVYGTRGIQGPAELLRVTYGLPAGLPPGIRYTLSPYQSKVSVGGQEVISTQPLIDGGVLRVLGYQPGDVNADGLIDLQDALLCLRIAVLGADPGLPDARYAADVDGNATVTVLDVLLILRRVLLGTPFPGP